MYTVWYVYCTYDDLAGWKELIYLQFFSYCFLLELKFSEVAYQNNPQIITHNFFPCPYVY